MKIEPTEEYDQQVYDLLKRIKYDLKMHDSNKVTFIDTYLPHNKRFYTNQFLIDKLVKKGIFEVSGFDEATVGTKPDYRSINFNLKVNIPAFDRYYEKYKKVFEIVPNIVDKKIISKIITSKSIRDGYLSDNQNAGEMKQHTEKPYFFIENHTFHLLQNDGLYGSIDFHPTKNSNNTDPYILMEAFISALKEDGSKEGDWIEISVSRERLTQKILQIHSEYKGELTEIWYKSTKGNLIKKIPENLVSLVDFQDFDTKTNTYKLRLKLPQLH